MCPFQVEFSDESDTEAKMQAEPAEKTSVPTKRSTTRRVAQKSKTVPAPAVEKVPPKRQSKGKKSTALSRASSSEDDDAQVCRAASARRGRTRGGSSRAGADPVEEPDKMRTIDEEIPEVLDLSIEQLRTSDTETEDNPASSKNVGAYFVHMVKVSVYFLQGPVCRINPLDWKVALIFGFLVYKPPPRNSVSSP